MKPIIRNRNRKPDRETVPEVIPEHGSEELEVEVHDNLVDETVIVEEDDG